MTALPCVTVKLRRPMSELGHFRPNWALRAMSGLHPVSDRTADIAGGPFRANSGLILTVVLHTSRSALGQVLRDSHQATPNRVMASRPRCLAHSSIQNRVTIRCARVLRSRLAPCVKSWLQCQADRSVTTGSFWQGAH